MDISARQKNDGAFRHPGADLGSGSWHQLRATFVLATFSGCSIFSCLLVNPVHKDLG